MKFIKHITWPEIFATWQSQEGADPVWQNYATKQLGWPSWALWRQSQTAHLNPTHRKWLLWEISQPNREIPDFLIGPFAGWQQHFKAKLRHTFADLANLHADWLQNNTGVKNRLQNFPTTTLFIGLQLENTEQIYLLEGHHRAGAVALSNYLNKPNQFTTNPQLACTEITQADLNNLYRQLNTDKPTNQSIINW